MANMGIKPVVGLTTKHGADEWNNRYSANYVRVLKDRNAHHVILAPDLPAVLPDGRIYYPDRNGALPVDILDHLDGIVLSGGGDVDPSEFGQELNGAETDRIDPKRDALELTLSRAALERAVPLFGICRGFQVLNVAAGGGLVQHFDGHRSPEDATAYHEVVVAEGSRLRTVSGVNEIHVNTFHHQGVDVACLAPGLIASGMASPDTWLVEAIESANHTWALGVQWHPERDFELDDTHRHIWDGFMAECRRRQETRLA